MTLYELSIQIKQLNKEKKFSHSLSLFEQQKASFGKYQIGSNKYLIYNIFSAMIEAGKCDLIFNFIKEYDVKLQPETFSYLLKKLKKNLPNWATVDRFCDLISVDALSTECRYANVTIKGETKSDEFASDRENWYSVKTKALFETKQYQKCLELSKQALSSFQKLHYSNNIWFALRIALSKRELGNVEEALSEILQILKKKKDWFIQKYVAEIYFEKGDYENSFKYAIAAINSFGDLEYKIELLVLLGKIFIKKQEMELAFKHFNLSRHIRIKNGWHVPNDLSVLIQKFDCPEIPIERYEEIKGELKKYWNSFKPVLQRSSGKILKIFNNNENGADGLIKKDKKSIYFRVKAGNSIQKQLKPGMEVTFVVTESEYGKKGLVRDIRCKDQ